MRPERVSLNSAAGGEPVETSISPDGSFEFRDVSPGTHIVFMLGASPTSGVVAAILLAAAEGWKQKAPLT